LLTVRVQAILPYALAFAAGAMIYVVVEELIPEAQSSGDSNIATIGAMLGFALMMVLDVALG
jgi:ZIP family zinc transporter